MVTAAGRAVTSIRRDQNVAGTTSSSNYSYCGLSSSVVRFALFMAGIAFLSIQHYFDWRTTHRPVGMQMTMNPSSISVSTGRADEQQYSTNHRPRSKTSFVMRRDFVVNADGGTTEFLWQTPRPKVDHHDPRAILFLAHGCGHDMKDWWSASVGSNNYNPAQLHPPVTDSCIDCRGLPEELAIVRMALDEFNLLVVAISSLNHCWSVQDGPRVVWVLEKLQRAWKLPIYALGASSGGTFVASVLARQKTSSSSPFLLSGYIVQIAAPCGEPIQIPTVFITMNRDFTTDQRVREVMEILRVDGVPAKHIRLPPLKLEKDFFASCIGEEYADHSQAMVDALKKNGLLQDGFLTQDPRRFEWRPHLAPFALKNDSLVPDQSEISEVLNCAWGMHEMTRDGVREGLSFLLTNS